MKPEENKNSTLGDRALSNKDGDRLGFREIAHRLAKSLVDHSSDEGLVIGLEGRWGSGKSSLLFLIEEELRALPESEQPTVINFKPWLVGNRDALLSRLFDDLAEGIGRIRYNRGDATDLTQRKIKDTVKKVRDFSARFDPLIDLARLGSTWANLPLAPQIIEGWQKLNKKSEDGKTLTKLKSDLTKALSELDHRFLVMIDDVDRLDPDELLEVLRLVRSVADFPKVVYLLCYDSEIVAKSISQAAKVDDGHAYLEKIIQLAIMVPLPEAFQLRRWFADELGKIAQPKSEDEAQRLSGNIDRAGGIWLKTPRTVVRTLDALRFHWAALQAEGCDLADIVWLTLIKDGNPNLYRWIEDYCLNASEMALGTAMIGETENTVKLQNLIAHAGDTYFADRNNRHDFCDHLPGMAIDYAEGSLGFTIYNRVDQSSLNSAIAARRLKSPDHFRHYFARSGPSFALTQSDYSVLWQEIDSANGNFGSLLLEWHSQAIGPNLSKADLLFDRFHSLNEELFSSERVSAILIGFGESMDAAYRLKPTDPFSYTSLWQRSSKLVKLLLNRLEVDQRSDILSQLFHNGKSICWLSRVFRWEIVAHGRHGHSSHHDNDQILTSLELDSITKIITGRYSVMTWSDIISSASPQQILWNLKDIEEPSIFAKWIKDITITDDGFIEFLELLTGWVESSDRGRYKILSRENLKGYFEIEDVIKRLSHICESSNQEPIVIRAKSLQKAVEMSKRF